MRHRRQRSPVEAVLPTWRPNILIASKAAGPSAIFWRAPSNGVATISGEDVCGTYPVNEEQVIETQSGSRA